MKRSLKRKNFADTVNVILEQHNEDKAFKMYLAYSSNMMNEPKSFEDYLNELKGNVAGEAKEAPKKNVEKRFMTKKETEKFIEKCNIELKSFAPPVQKGGV